MRLSYPLGLQPHQGIFAASRQTPLPPSLRSAPSPEGKVDKTASNTLPPQTNHRCFTRLEQPPASNHPAYFLPLRLPRRQRGGWCRAANAARNLFGSSTSTYPAPVALSATRRTCAHSNQLRPPGLLLGGAMQPSRAKRGVSRTVPAVPSTSNNLLPRTITRTSLSASPSAVGRLVPGSERSAELIRRHDEMTSFPRTSLPTRVSARSESHGACRPLRLEQTSVSQTSASNPRCPFYSRPLKHPMTFFANCVCTKRITRSPGSSTDSPFGMTAAPSRT